MRTSGQGYGAFDNARQKYAGMETDDATGMDHTLWRQYDSSSGRWTAPDPYGGSMSVASPQSFNRYSYVDNDPVNKIDPSGLMLSDIGVFQTNDPEEAATTQRKSDADWKKAINNEYAREHHGTVDYDKDGNATFISRYSAVNYFRKQLRAAGSVFVAGAVVPQDPGQPSGDGTTLHYWPSRIWRDANGNQVDKSPYGHIALQLSDGTYISYWPGEHLGPLDIGKKVNPSLNRTYLDDYNGEHQTDSLTYQIYGLDEGKIKKWWNNGKGHEKFSSGNNCADIVTEALRQGGLPPFTGNLIWSTPWDVWNGTKTSANWPKDLRNLRVPF